MDAESRNACVIIQKKPSAQTSRWFQFPPPVQRSAGCVLQLWSVRPKVFPFVYMNKMILSQGYICFKNVANIAQLLEHIKSAVGKEAGLYTSSG